MEFRELLLKRRSVRKFTQERVSDAYINELMHAAMSGPSACNRMPWDFYVISDKNALAALRKATHFANVDAPLAIVVCGNMSKALPQPLNEYWIQDCSAASENILLRAADLGLGAVWCGVHPQKRPERVIAGILGLNEEQIPLNLIFIGHPAEEPEPRDQYDEANVHFLC